MSDALLVQAKEHAPFNFHTHVLCGSEVGETQLDGFRFDSVPNRRRDGLSWFSMRNCPSFSEDNSKLRTKIMRSLLYLNYLIVITDIASVILRMSMEDY